MFSKPVLLLDIDGVIMAPEYIQKPTARSIEQLNRIIQETDCDIIITSAWKIVKMDYNKDKAEEYLRSWGVEKPKVIGFTKGFAHGEEIEGKNAVETSIIQWVEKNKPSRWCALDDSIDDGDRMVKTQCLIGLTEIEADKVIYWLMTEV